MPADLRPSTVRQAGDDASEPFPVPPRHRRPSPVYSDNGRTARYATADDAEADPDGIMACNFVRWVPQPMRYVLDPERRLPADVQRMLDTFVMGSFNKNNLVRICRDAKVSN